MGEGEGGMFQENSIETCILSRVKQISSPGWMHERSAWAWCTGKTQRDQVEREVGGGIGMGNTCKSMGDSCYCIKILIFQDRTVCPIFGAQSPNPLPPSYSSREKEQNELSLK